MVARPHGPDRRGAIRLFFNPPLQVAVAWGQGESVSRTPGFVRDISNRGAFFWSLVEPQIGQPVQLELEVPAPRGPGFLLRLSCDAEVVRTERRTGSQPEFGVAVRIVRFQEPDIVPGPLETAG